MPESIAGLLSAAFYKNRLRTGGDAAATDESEGGGAWEAATHHPMPAVLVDAQGNESRATGSGASAGAFVNEKEAAAAVRLASLYVTTLGVEPHEVCIACFHTSQKALINTKLRDVDTKASLKGVQACTIDEIARRKAADVIIVSCARAGAGGAAAAAGAGGGLGPLSDARYVCTVLSRARCAVLFSVL